jgi:xanthine/CO dehydrogenase XdhC/CoxF family maturation factor
VRDLESLRERLRALPPGSRAALATIVRVEGSSYRREGARLLVEADGRLTGMLSAGCLERDLARLAAETTESGAARAIEYDLTEEGEAIWGAGTGCAGHVTLLVEPLDDAARATWLGRLETLFDARRELRLATVYAAAPPEAAGAPRPGTTVAAAAEAATGWRVAAWSAVTALAAGEARALRVAGERFEVALLAEAIPPPIHLLLLGAERDVPALARLGRELGWAVTVVDPRPTEAAAASVAGLARYLGAAPRALAGAVELSARTAAVLATHRYLDDLAYLAELDGAEIGHLALLGPVARRRRLLGDLERLAPGAAERLGTRLAGPAGLDLGGRRPEEVALSVVAEIQARFHGRDARPLSSKPGR